MIDPLLSLAFAIQANPGVFALLLGSGASRASGILTGWEVVLDMIRRYAWLAGDDPEPDPASWYQRKFATEPTYPVLLEQLAKTPAERSQILRSYFEPSETEREEGQKLPTKAHREIARLVAAGYIRVIVTPNFDRLIEQAIEQAGVTPVVISTADQAIGAVPLAHTRCVVIKVNGDYMDPRIKNSTEELAEYEPPIVKYLERVWDEYGLTVVGWSAEWDVALRQSLERRRSRRFSTYWTCRRPLSETSRRLADHLGVTMIQIADAEEFFVALAEKVFSIADLKTLHPATPQIAAATVKRLLRRPEDRIRLDDFVTDETERLWRELSPERFAVYGEETPEAIKSRATEYETLSAPLLAMLAAGCYWGEPHHEKTWTRSLTRIANPAGERSGQTKLLSMRSYPATLLLYGAGIAGMAGDRAGNLAALTRAVVRKGRGDQDAFIVQEEFTNRGFAKSFPGLERNWTPLSDHLFDVLREPLRRYLPTNEEYEDSFDAFEFIIAAAYAHATRDLRPEGREYAPLGRFAWNRRRDSRGMKPSEKLGEPYLQVGMFDGSQESLDAALARVATVIGRSGFW